MTILLTTANFPDIMLPAYKTNWWQILLFVAYMFGGLYFLSNVLLATVYSRFRCRLEEEALNLIREQEVYLSEYIDILADGNEDVHVNDEKLVYLKPKQTQTFFEEIFSLNPTEKRYDYDTL